MIEFTAYEFPSNDYWHVIPNIIRHEPPVTAEPIHIIKETDDIVVVNKPPSIPVSFLYQT